MLYKKDIHYTLKIKFEYPFFTYKYMEPIDFIIELIESSIMEEADLALKSWNIIKSNFDSEIDADRRILQEGEQWISEYQKNLTSETKISSLKIKYNAQWYFIEIPHSQNLKILDYFIPKQSLTSVSRYTTKDLQEFESKLISASEELHNKEYDVFIEIRNSVELHYNIIHELSRNISNIDFLSSAAHYSLQNSCSTPELGLDFWLEIQWGKHPVISREEYDFISNDLRLKWSEFIHVITWPNMWGKSTFLRQNALLVLLTHVGYDIPCRCAKIGLVDKIFSRVWAADNLYLWQSTFMVEMQEIAYILRHSTKRSFVIIDEVWRGTSTYDGMSLAWSILEYNQKNIWAKTLFATHYHEIIEYAENLRWAWNYSVSVGENEKNIVFLRKIIPWWIKKSYGIEVASLAWIPDAVVDGAKRCMNLLQGTLYSQQLSLNELPINDKNKDSQNHKQECQEIISVIKELDLDRLSPIESLQKLSEIQEKIKTYEKKSWIIKSDV